VRVLEAGPRPGGKAGIVEVDGVVVETGPSVLTLAEVFAGLFARAGLRLDEVVGRRRLDPGFRYRYDDGCVLEVAHDPQQTLAAVRSALGPDAEAQLASFLAYSRQIWEAAAPNFVLGPAPTWGGGRRSAAPDGRGNRPSRLRAASAHAAAPVRDLQRQ
jgi:phytoene desaturase